MTLDEWREQNMRDWRPTEAQSLESRRFADAALFEVGGRHAQGTKQHTVAARKIRSLHIDMFFWQAVALQLWAEKEFLEDN